MSISQSSSLLFLAVARIPFGRGGFGGGSLQATVHTLQFVRTRERDGQSRACRLRVSVCLLVFLSARLPDVLFASDGGAARPGQAADSVSLDSIPKVRM